MEFKQIKFRVLDSDLMDEGAEYIGGIGVYDCDELISVICGCCGGTFEPDEVEVLEKYNDWMDLTEAIVGD